MKALDKKGLKKLWQKIKDIAAKKLDKTGGTITGSLNVNGTVSEKGSTLYERYVPKGVSSSSLSSKSIPSGTWTVVAEIELEPGYYIGYISCQFASSDVGYRGLAITTTGTGTDPGANRLQQAHFSPIAAASVFQLSRNFGITEKTKYYIWAYQNRGSNMTVYPGYNFGRFLRE